MTLLPTPSGLLSWGLQSTLLLGAGWLFYHGLLRQERCFRFNRGFLLLMPWLALLLPGLLKAARTALAAWSAGAVTAAPRLPALLLPELTIQPATVATLPGAGWLPGLYLTGVLLLLLLLLGRVLRLWYTTRHFPREARPGYVLVHTQGRRPAGSFGRWVFWNDADPLSATEAAAVLAHEVAHVHQHHTLERLSLDVARALLWFNPLAHAYARALAQVHEFLADEAALHSVPGGQPAPASYASLLARLALRQWQPALPLAHSFTQSLTLIRIRMLTTQTPVRRWKQWLLLPLSLTLVGLLACEQEPDMAAPTGAAAAPGQTLPAPPPPPAVYTYVEQMPEYQGGQAQLMADLARLVEYPAAARAEQLEAKVFVSFIVAADGTVQAAEIRKGAEHRKGAEGQAVATAGTRALNAVALRAVQRLSGHWQPGQQGGQPVAVQFTVPITFALK